MTLLALTALLGNACVSPQTSAGPTTSSRVPSRPEPSPTVVTGHVRVENEALGASKRFLARAIGDLKQLGFWHTLTDHLYVLHISSRPGLDRIPADGHLADAFLTGEVDKTKAGSLCDIMFFPDALTADLARYAGYYARGLLPDPTPTLREYWVSILGHELAHCLHHGRGEPTARRWEKKVLTAARNGL